MANNSRTAPASKRKRSKGVQSVEVARDWISRGIAVVPIRGENKRPKTDRTDDPETNGKIKGQPWNKVRIKESQLEDYFESGDNVGGLWGKPSGWVVDVDLDWDEAAKIAPSILPETFIYGRTSRPGTHYLYRCKDIKTFKRGTFGKDGEVIVELRSTGTQSVLPPSIHPSGERFEINHETEFAKISPKRLEQLVNRIAAGAVFVRHYPEGGGRHDFVHALTGALLWSQWTPEDVAQFLGAILNGASDRETDRGQRERTVVNTIEKYEGGERVNGWPTLEQWVPAPDLANCRKWCSIKGLPSVLGSRSGRPDGGDAEEVPDDLPDNSAESVNPIPSLVVPGLVGKIASWVHRTSYADQPLFDLGAAFTILALATQNKYVIQSTNTPLSPFFMALGRTGGGKDSARQAVINASEQIKLSEKAFGGFQSFHAMLDELAKPPSTMCWLWDEAARRLRAASKSTSGQDNQVLTWLLDLYGKGASTVLGLPGRKQSVPKITHPFLIVLAFAQPEQMIESITTADISTGLLNRFILLDAGDVTPQLHYPDPIGFPSAIANPLIDISKVRTPDDKEFIEVAWESTKVYNQMRDFREECRELSGLEAASGEVWGRAWQNALILCGLLAVGCDHKRPKITTEIATWATRFMKWSCNCWMIRIDASSARSLTERHSKALERIVREPYAFRKFVKNPLEMKLIGQRLMPKTLLYRLCRHIKQREVDEIVGSLVEADCIGAGEKYDVEIFWYKTNDGEDE